MPSTLHGSSCIHSSCFRMPGRWDNVFIFLLPPMRKQGERSHQALEATPTLRLQGSGNFSVMDDAFGCWSHE